MMRRRTFVSGLIVAPLAGRLGAPFAATSRIHRIGMLGNEDNPPWEGLRQGLRELGYVEGRNMHSDWRWSGGDADRLASLARELVAFSPDVLVTSGTRAAIEAAGATRSIPVVMAISQHPEEIGLVKSLARPGGNLTGLTTYSPQLTAKRLELLRELVPRSTRIAALYSPDSESQRMQHVDLLETAPAAGFSVQSVELRWPEDFARSLSAIRPEAIDALLVTGNPITFRGRRAIADFAMKNRLASVFEERLFVEVGGLMSYGPSFWDLFHRSASYVDKILRGAQPADLPVERPLRFEYVVNRTTAAALRIALRPATILRADLILD